MNIAAGLALPEAEIEILPDELADMEEWDSYESANGEFWADRNTTVAEKLQAALGKRDSG